MRRLLTLLTSLLLTGLPATLLAAEDGPNFLIIVADDCTYNDLPLYGGQNARTPHIDALAARGLTFNQAYLASAMCQPCRAELLTGQYPLRNGCAWNHSASLPTTRSLPHYLKPLGYRVGLAGKVHVKPASSFPLEKVAGFDPNCVRDPTRPHELDGIEAFMTRREDEPFCLIVALVEPHLPWVMGDASQYPPKKLRLPPNLADTPSTRKHFADYLAEITYMDEQVGEILATLKSAGKEKDTLVLFTSEQGSQFPGSKWTNWNTGIHTALVAAWPEKIESGKRTDALVQYADIAPTLLDLASAGQASADHPFDGSSFAPVLSGQHSDHRKYAYGMHNNLPEGPRYPIRSITDGNWHYIRNLMPEELYLEKHLMGGGRLNNPYWATWMGADPKNTGAYRLIKRYMRRPAEELYRHTDDPYELTNLAGRDEHRSVLRRLRSELDLWMKEQNDPGASVDTMDALTASRKGRHLHGPHVD
ncbi:MAG: sulfatase [Verrucomicrobiota bacterium]